MERERPEATPHASRHPAVNDAGEPPDATTIGLILPGGGARGAYQVGVLAGIADLVRTPRSGPFRVICGTSVGAMTAAYLASQMSDFHSAVVRLERLWSDLKVNQVYSAGYGKILGVLMRWVWSLLSGGFSEVDPRWLLDNAPLRDLIAQNIDFEAIGRWVKEGLLRGISITVTGYFSERSLTYFQAPPDVQSWWRERREGRPARITLDHVMASLALPVVFPPVRIDDEWCGDGSTRQFAPLAPAIHLGAKRLLIVDTQYRHASGSLGKSASQASPSLSRIGAYLLDTIFSDSLYVDLERAGRVNRALEHMPPDIAQRSMPGMRRIDSFLIAPSRRPADIAARHIGALPKPVRWLLRSLGGEKEGSEQLLSYLLFESVYARELVALGRSDVLARQDDLRRFLGLGNHVFTAG